MPKPVATQEKYQEKPNQAEPADLNFLHRKFADLEFPADILEHRAELTEYQIKTEKIELAMRQREEQILEEKWQGFTRRAYEEARQNWDDVERAVTEADRRYQQITDKFPEGLETFSREISRRHQIIEETVQRYRRDTKPQQLRQQYQSERGDQIKPDQERHRRIMDRQQEMSNNRFLEHLASDQDLPFIIAQLERHRDVPLYEIGACVGAMRREEPRASALKKSLAAKYGDRLDILLPAIQSVFDQLADSDRLDPHILEQPVPVEEIISSLTDLPFERQAEFLHIEKQLAEIDVAVEAERLAGSPEWGKNLVQGELGYNLQGEFAVEPGDLGFYITASVADYEKLSWQPGVKEISAGVLVAQQAKTRGLSGAIFIMRPSAATPDKIQELELKVFQTGLEKSGFKQAWAEEVRPEAQAQARQEFSDEQLARSKDFNNHWLQSITPQSPEEEIRQVILTAIDSQVAVKMANFQVGLMRLLDRPWEAGSSQFNLKVSFAEINHDLLVAQGEAAEFSQQLRFQGYPEFYVRLAQGESTAEIQKYLTVVNRVQKLVDSVLRQNATPELQRELYRRFRDNPPFQWEREIDVVRRDYSLA